MSSELVQRAQQGDHEAFDALATGSYARLHGIARRILRDPDAAQDAVQDALIRAWRDLRSLRDLDRYDAFMHRLLVRACHDQVRRRRRRPVEVRDVSNTLVASRDDLSQIDDRDALERAFLLLPVSQRAALVLTHYVGLPASEVGAVLGIPAGTVHSRLHYGATAMRAALAPTATPRIAIRGHGR